MAEASVTKRTGFNGETILDFELPRGPKGDKGDKGNDGSNVLPTNEAIANAVTADGPAKTALNAAIGGQVQPLDTRVVDLENTAIGLDQVKPGTLVPAGRKAYFPGDSIADGAGSSNTSRAYRSLVPRIAGTANVTGTNGGVSGQRSDQITARIPVMITAGANLIVYMAGTNDASQSVTLATYKANVEQAHALCLAAKVPFVLNTVPPVGPGSGNDARHALVQQYNTWIRLWAPTKGIPVAEVFGALADPLTGRLKAAYDSGDGTHPSDDGHYAIATAVAPLVKSLAAPRPWPVVTAGGGLLVNPLHNSTNPYDGWTLLGTVGQSVTTDETPAAGELPAGKWMKVVVDNTAGGSQVNATRKATIAAYNASTAPLGWSPGDTLAIFFYAKCSDSKGTGMKVQIANQSEVAVSVLLDYPSVAAPGPQMALYAVPATGVTALSFAFTMGVPAGQNITGYLGASDVINLTKLGIAAPA